MSNFSMSSMSLSSVTSTSSSVTSTGSKNSNKLVPLSQKNIKSSQEYRNLRQQFFQLQSSHNSLKLVHEREMILAASQKAQANEQLKTLQIELDEIKKDQVILIHSKLVTLNNMMALFQSQFPKATLLN